MTQRKVIYQSAPPVKPSREKESIYPVLTFIGEQSCVRFDTLQKVFARYGRGSGRSVVYEFLKNSKESGLLTYEKIGAYQYIYLLKDGMKKVGLPFKAIPPNYGRLKHYYVCAEVRLWIENKFPDLLRVVSERELRKGGTGIRPGQKDPHLADMVAIFEDAQVKVECEITPKYESDLRRIINLLDDDLDCSSVWYFVNDKTEALIRKHIEDRPKFHLKHIKELNIECE